MDKRNFESFMSAVKAKSLTEIRGAEVVRVLKELLSGEFAEVKERKFKVILKKPSGGGLASVNKVDGKVLLWIDPAFHEQSLRPLLRHELLHVLTGFLDDGDPAFKAQARKRKIDIWRV